MDQKEGGRNIDDIRPEIAEERWRRDILVRLSRVEAELMSPIQNAHLYQSATSLPILQESVNADKPDEFSVIRASEDLVRVKGGKVLCANYGPVGGPWAEFDVLDSEIEVHPWPDTVEYIVLRATRGLWDDPAWTGADVVLVSSTLPPLVDEYYSDHVVVNVLLASVKFGAQFPESAVRQYRRGIQIIKEAIPPGTMALWHTRDYIPHGWSFVGDAEGCFLYACTDVEPAGRWEGSTDPLVVEHNVVVTDTGADFRQGNEELMKIEDHVFHLNFSGALNRYCVHLIRKL